LYRCLERKLSGDFDLTPRVPEQHTAHAIVSHVVDHALVKFVQPVFDGRHAVIDLAHSLIAETEKIRIEHWKVLICRAASGHVGAGGSAHGFGVILVLEAQSHLQRLRREIRHIACGINIGVAGS
jgi:hypothetical protein